MTKSRVDVLQGPPHLDTRGRNILHLIEDSIVDATSDAERRARQELLDRVRALREAHKRSA